MLNKLASTVLTSAMLINFAAAHGAATQKSGPDAVAEIEAIRKATQRFENVEVALAEGYIPDPSGVCVEAAKEGLPSELGSMGIHYIRPDLLGLTAASPEVDGTGTHTDFLKPAMLLYEPQADGSLELVGVENLVFEKAWKEAGNVEPPSFAGRTWDYMVDDPNTPAHEAHHFTAHYDQHVWFRDNPNGNLMPFNPTVTCKHHVDKGKATH